MVFLQKHKLSKKKHKESNILSKQEWLVSPVTRNANSVKYGRNTIKLETRSMLDDLC